MAILAVFILILYYYIFVLFEENIKKPQNLAKDVVYLNNELTNGTQLPSDQFYDYDSGTVKGPYEYSVQYDDVKNELTFTAHDNNFDSQRWKLPLLPNYYWRDGKIVEKDSCFNVPNNSNVKAEGKILFDYIQNNNMITDRQIGGQVSQNKIFHSDRLFYFKCKNNRIESLHSCPSGTLLNDHIQCEMIHTCTGQPDNYKYPDEFSRFKYFECIKGKAHHKSCPKGELFEFSQCIVPDNVCEVKSDGWKKDIDRTSFFICQNGKAIVHHCPPYTYVLDGNCEKEVCENLHGKFVPILNDNGTFEYAPQYGKCEHGRLVEILNCPTLWDHWNTDVQILHLPQVFDSTKNACTKPVLCKNVKITNPNVVVPTYTYTKHLKNWGLSQLFDLTTGYTCDSSGNKVQVDTDPGELIINYQKTKVESKVAYKIPVKNPSEYFDVLNNQLESCPQNTFFDGSECKPRTPHSFTFRHLDIFKFDHLYINGWIHPENVEYTPKKFDCQKDYVPMDFKQGCVHKDCTKYQFLYQLKGSIKLDHVHRCFRHGDTIHKEVYTNPHNLKLEFWNQRLTTEENPQDVCTFGTRINTGNFILDSTVYMTCDPNQPFVFCPSQLTDKIVSVGNVYACSPKSSVYEVVLPQGTPVLVYMNETLHIKTLSATFIQIGKVRLYYNANYLLKEAEIRQKFNVIHASFYFESDGPCILYFKKLPTNPENVYIENGQMKVSQSDIYNILHDRNDRYAKDVRYGLESSITDLKY